DEGEFRGDRFGGRTIEFAISSISFIPPKRLAVMEFDVSIFVPNGASPNTNRVHLFFSPGGVTTDHGLNAVLTHGLRGPSDPTEWILIGVPGAATEIGGRVVSGWRTIDMANIQRCLQRVG